MLLLVPNAGLLAEETMATVRGTVRAPKSVAILETLVVAKNVETGRSRAASIGAEGKFEILELPPGAYLVQASQAGYVSRMQKEVELRAGQVVQLAFVLESLSGTQRQETQNDDGDDDQNDQDDRNAGEPDISSSAVDSRISESQLAGLPLNGRSYSQLATLQGGVSDPFAGSSSRGGGSGGLTISGGRPTANTFLLDGTNIMNTTNQVPRSAAGVQLGSDAILQVHVFAANYGAEYGRGSGGVLNSITRSGTPQWHGTFFEFFRNSNLDARNFFDPGPEPTPFKRNQFGSTITGPVLKDRTFFMASFEGLRDRLTETIIDHFPDELARQGIIVERDGTVREVDVHPRVKPYLELYPPLNGPSLGRGVGENAASQFLPTNENFFTVRVDHKISGRDSFFARYSFDDATSHRSESSFLFKTQINSRQQYLTLVESHVFNPQVLNAFRFGFTRPIQAWHTISSIAIPESLFFVDGSPGFGQISVPGFSDFGPNRILPAGNIMNTFQFADDLLMHKDNHSLQLGFNLHRYRWNASSHANQGGVWSFNSLESFLRAGPEGTALTVGLPGSNNSHAYRQTLVGFYLQDSYRVNSSLRFNFGLRYEFVSMLNDDLDRTVFLADLVRDREVRIGPYLESNPSPRAPAPRLGVVWSPWGSRDTVLRAGFGIYHDQFLAYVMSRQKASAPFYKTVIRNNFNSSEIFPNAVTAATGEPFQAQILDYQNATTPVVFRYNFAIQQPLPGGWQLQASYVGARGNHLYRVYEANLFPVPITRADGSLCFPPDAAANLPYHPACPAVPSRDAGPVNPAIGSIKLINSDAQSFYNSFRFSASKTLGSGISLRSSYTYSKSVDDGSALGELSEQYGLARTLERGLSDFDIRHRFVVNYFYTAPLGAGRRWLRSGVLGQAFGGWRLGGIVSWRTGTPFSPGIRVRTPGFLFAAKRPNLLPGRSNNPVLGGPNRYFDSSVYAVPEPGTLGNTGRNTITAPSVLGMDISLQREFLLDARRRLQFRAEIFNLLNHPNFSGLSGGSAVVFSGESGRPNPTAGRIKQTITTARQIQFALRFSF